MIKPRLLTEDELLECFSQLMRDVTLVAEPVVDIWPYVDNLSPPDAQSLKYAT
ncbi:hypothetical protein ACRQ1B_27845 [Rhizobium panacihumi]|uniref:hypothetical protein n=1 Tax=Rhizobium panacihumi TaxID=2008450 RepID=UPI003D7BD86C